MQNVADIVATCLTMRSLTRRVERICHKFCMDNFFSPDILDDLHIRGISCCGTVRHYHEGMPWSLSDIKIKMGWHMC
jgi:hypothetical protein